MANNRGWGVLIGLALFAQSATMAHAYQFSIDNFSVLKNGGQFFEDPFDDGNPPPSAPNFSSGASAKYFVSGAVGPESAGKLLLDSNDAVLRTTPEGDQVLFQAALLATDITGNLGLGLKIADVLELTGVFDLVLPPEPGQSYGIRFTDRATGIGKPGNDLVTIGVFRTLTAQLAIQFLEANFEDGTIDILDSVLLETSHDQIALRLTRPDTQTNAVSASFAYIDGNTVGAFQPLSGTADIFEGEDWTRAQFLALQSVPEPTTIVLLGLGMAGIGYQRCKQMSA